MWEFDENGEPYCPATGAVQLEPPPRDLVFEQGVLVMILCLAILSTLAILQGMVLQLRLSKRISRCEAVRVFP